MMRALVILSLLFTAAAVIYRWRYKLMNTVLAVGIIRKLMVALSMKLPRVRSSILPELFNAKTNNYE